ncbi:hypothetical protein DMUE_0545 [Dictyocoela muelleri]|nr:hypothetical protein DMUE_0545 [Dictyocoela muelleri]
MAPKGFYQIYIIYAKVIENFFSFLFAFLPNKNEKTYLKLFKQIEIIMQENQPKYIIMDFEMAPMSAFFKIFKNTKIYNCYFHFTQIIWRFVQKIGLVNKYKSNNNLGIM